MNAALERGRTMNERKLPVSRRLSRCAEMVEQGACVADIGCDHGYLSIELLLSGKAAFVHACDLREQPLRRAMENAKRFGVTEKIRFSRADGLAAVDPFQVDTVVCAGMGGELIANILAAAAWLKDPRYRLILQPQSSANLLRRRLWELGFGISKETLVEENGFLYHILVCRFTRAQTRPTPGEEYCSKALLRSGDELLSAYLARVRRSLTVTVQGLSQSRDPQGRGLDYYTQALAQIGAMEEEIKCQG